VPTIKWNKNWEKNLKNYLKDPKNEKYFGDRWGSPNELAILKKTRDRFVLPFVDSKKIAVEIGFGGGRWTQFLLDFGKLYCVELNRSMFDYFIERFGSRPNVSFCLTSGTDLPGIPKNSVDYVFSFGTFVHLDVNLIGEYLKSIKYVLTEKSDVIIQYSDQTKEEARKNPGFSLNTSKIMQELVLDAGFSIISDDVETLPHANVIHFSPKT